MAISEQEVALRRRDGDVRPARVWRGDATPRAALVVAHGMGEHGARYREPLAPLIAYGILVYSLEHRGHGEGAVGEGKQGDFGPGGFLGVIDDLRALVAAARDANPGLPTYLLGHSMGSMIAQAFVVEHSDLIDGLILSGALAVDFVGPPSDEPDAVGQALNAPFQPARTGFDWLSRDEAQVDRYVADPLCGFGLVADTQASIAAEGARLADPATLAQIRRSLPVYIFSGDADPLHSVLNAWAPIGERYRAAGLRVEERLYSGGRHEMLNETNRDEVVRDLAAVLDRWIGDR